MKQKRRFMILILPTEINNFLKNKQGRQRTKHNYNIASRATQSNSVYVSVLQISTEHADGLMAAIVSAGKNIFRDNNECKQRLGPPVPKRRQFSDLFSWARVLKWGRKREKQRKRRLDISAVTTRFTGRGWNASNFDRKTLVKTSKWQTGLFQPSKVSLTFSVLKLLTTKLELSTENLK